MNLFDVNINKFVYNIHSTHCKLSSQVLFFLFSLEHGVYHPVS